MRRLLSALSSRLPSILLLLAVGLASLPLFAYAEDIGTQPAVQMGPPSGTPIDVDLVARAAQEVLEQSGGGGGLPPWMVPASGAVNVVLTLVVFWLRESARREFAMRQDAEKRRDETVTKVERLIADTREAYATKQELRFLEQRMDEQHRASSAKMEAMLSLQGEQGKELVGLRKDVNQLVEFLRPVASTR